MQHTIKEVTMTIHNLKKGDLIRNKSTGDVAIITGEPYVRFVPDDDFYTYGVESGVAMTFYPVTYTVKDAGFRSCVKQSILKRHWERVK